MTDTAPTAATRQQIADIAAPNIGTLIAQALALDPDTTSTVTLTPEGGDTVIVTVEMQRYITTDDPAGRDLVTILGQYRLVPIEVQPCDS